MKKISFAYDLIVGAGIILAAFLKIIPVENEVILPWGVILLICAKIMKARLIKPLQMVVMFGLSIHVLSLTAHYLNSWPIIVILILFPCAFGIALCLSIFNDHFGHTSTDLVTAKKRFAAYLITAAVISIFAGGAFWRVSGYLGKNTRYYDVIPGDWEVNPTIHAMEIEAYRTNQQKRTMSLIVGSIGAALILLGFASVMYSAVFYLKNRKDFLPVDKSS